MGTRDDTHVYQLESSPKFADKLRAKSIDLLYFSFLY